MKDVIVRYAVFVFLLTIAYAAPDLPATIQAQGTPFTENTESVLLFGKGLSAQNQSFLAGKLFLADTAQWMYARRSTLDTDMQFSVAAAINSLEANHPGTPDTFQPVFHVTLAKQGKTPLAPSYDLDETTGTVTIAPQRAFSPGLYTVSVDAEDPLSGTTQRIQQNFAWGVLAMNPDKDSYATGETARIDFGVLDERGEIVCDAALTLTVYSPSGTRLVLSTEDGSIVSTGSCGHKAAGFIEPDYQTALLLHEPGIHTAELVAITQNGAWTVSSSLSVSDTAPIRIKRTAATRLWPFGPSPMHIKIFFAENFTGTITDIVPAGFDIIETQPHATAHHIDDALGAGTALSWNGSWRAGDIVEFSYTYDAPNISPEFYLIGPLQGTSGTNQGSTWTEQRSWQIANDAGEEDNWLTGWTYRKKISIDHTNVDSNLTDFPLHVRIAADTDIGANALSTGYDLRFTSSTGMLLNYERESFVVSSGSGTGFFWVKIPSISSSAATNIYLYYGKAGSADGADPTNVWDNNFLAIHHMDDVTSSTIADSTAHDNDGTKKGENEPQESTGKIGKTQLFDASTDVVHLEDDISRSETGTMSVWVKLNDKEVKNQLLAVQERWNSYRTIHFFIEGYSAFSARRYRPYTIIRTSGLTSFTIHGSTALAEDTWYQVSLVQAGGEVLLYVNGAAETLTGDNTTTNWWQGLATTNVAWDIGNREDGYTQGMTGLIDEVRISDVARSAAWLKFEYYNIAESDNELTWDTEEALAEGGSIFFFFFGF